MLSRTLLKINLGRYTRSTVQPFVKLQHLWKLAWKVKEYALCFDSIANCLQRISITLADRTVLLPPRSLGQWNAFQFLLSSIDVNVSFYSFKTEPMQKPHNEAMYLCIYIYKYK